MDLRRYLELYVAETQEHLRILHRCLLALEGSASAETVDEAFRSAHTIKGLSAAMGYRAVAERAHELEDTLDGVRKGHAVADAALVDRLLSEADLLESGITDAVNNITPQLDGGEAAAATAAPVVQQAGGVTGPDGTVHVLTATLRPDAPIKAARAMLITRALEGKPGVLGFSPDPVPDDFDGTLQLFLGADADAEALRTQVQQAGDVASATLQVPGSAPAAPSAPAAQSRVVPGAPSGRQVRVEERQLDGLAEWIGELSVLKNRLAGTGVRDGFTSAMFDRMGGLLSELQLAVLQMRMVPLAEAFERLPRVVRDACRRTGKEVDLVIEGQDIELDRAILNEIGDPLIHLLRNAVDHGVELPEQRVQVGKPERGVINLKAERERSSVRIVLQDDGAGVNRMRVLRKAQEAGLLPRDTNALLTDDDLFRLLAHPGFSTVEQVTDVSGRGVGLDAVVNRIRAIGGAVEMHTHTGHGTTFAIRLPITLALAQALRVRVGGEDYAIPLTHVAEALELSDMFLAGTSAVRVRDEVVPLVRLRQVLNVAGEGEEAAAVIAEFGDRRAALAVDELVGHEQILVKNFDAAPGTLPLFSGATLLEDGRPALVLDPLSVI